MRAEQRARLGSHGISFDTETHLIQPGLAAPPLVCGSIAIYAGNQFAGELLDREGALQAFRDLIEDESRIITGANIAFDMLVCAVEWAKRGVDLMPAIFRAYEQERVYDVLIGEALHAIAEGHLNKDPRTGGDIRDPITGETKNRYSLAISVDLTLDRRDAKVNDEWRTRYYELRDIPIELWPKSARDYPIDDAVNTHEDAMAQCGLLPKRADHQWVDSPDGSTCARCGVELTFGQMPACRVTKPHRNLHAMADQAWTAFALALGAAWGFTVDQAMVAEIAAEVREKRARVATPLLAAGLLKHKTGKDEDGEVGVGRDTAAVARAIALAYGASKKCAHCRGTAKVISPKAKLVRCKACKGKGISMTGGRCPGCDGLGKAVTTAESAKINCQECRSSGYDLTDVQVPCTEPSNRFPNGQIQATRDTLYESGDESLAELAEWLEDAKVEGTYIPYLRTGRVQCVGPDGEVFYRDRPLTLKPNVMLETDRTSYEDSIHQFPRKGRLRQCMKARAGYVYCSVDWNMGESLTHAQSCRWLLGYSDLGDALNKDLDPHASLAAQVMGLTYDEFMHRYKVLKDKACVDMRQAMKPLTFGKPAAMGDIKIVMTQRKNGPDTACPSGPAMISDGKDDLIPGYKGLRFCVVTAGAERCGVEMVTSWGAKGYERDCVPLCKACLECVSKISKSWKSLWRENVPYGKFAGDVSDNGQPISQEMAEFLGIEGDRLAPGEMLQHVSAIVRGAVGYSDACNGWFQSLLGVAAKLALRRAQRECCDSTYRVPSDACAGGVVSKYAGQRSPLYGSRCIALLHDELLAELLEHSAHHGAMRLDELMVRALQEICPDMAPAVKAPAALMRIWYKGAEPRWLVGGDKPANDEDVLVPWEPKRKAA